LRERKEFDIPINPSGKTLEQQIYIEILNIPYGERISYKELIDKSGITTTTRMISSVVHKNPIPIIIPCHRLRRNDNKPISYVGGNDIFEKLTSIEAPHP
jgi:methylated-DNA-[protein]-cysteine S-methyltransferase